MPDRLLAPAPAIGPRKAPRVFVLSHPVTAWLVLGGSLVLTAVGWVLSARYVQKLAEDRFRYESADVRSGIEERMAAYEQMLRGATGLFAASDHVSREEFREYVETLRIAAIYPGVQAVGFAELVPADEREAHVARVRDEGFPTYDIHPPGARESYTSIVYIEPFAGRNLRAFGYDMTTEAVRRAAMERARDTGEPSASGVVTLVQDTGPGTHPGFLLYLPVYRRGAPTETVEQRREALVGFVYSPFRMSDLMAGLLGSGPTQLDFEIFDGPRPDSRERLYSTGGERTSAFERTDAIEVGGRLWTLRFRAQSSFVPAIERTQPLLVGFVGIVLDVLLFSIVTSFASTRQRALREADRASSALAESREQTQAIMEAAPDAIISADATGSIIQWNRAASRTFGYAPGEMLGKPLGLLVPPRIRAEHAIETRHLFATGALRVGPGPIELVGYRKDGSEFPAELTYARWTAGSQFFVTGIVRDVTERKRAEREAARQQRELVRSNEELEQFAYVSSHDLQEPLRMIASYTQLLASAYQGKLDATADEYIHEIVDAVKRMRALIHSLLEYSRIGSRGRHLARTNSEEVLARVLSNLGPAIEESGATITHDPLPTLVVDPVQLGQVLQNLIGNAIKFRADEAPRVHVAAVREGNAWHWSVTDNGIGIEPGYADRIFVIFQRLHGRRDYPGTGIGLAICKKVVEGHGGRIWVDSAPGQGATFHFTLPAEGAEAHD